VRWTLPRLRIDQVMMTCLKYLLPLSCALLAGAAVWQVAMPAIVQNWLKVPVGIACLALVLFVGRKMWTTQQKLPASGVAFDWKPTR
jgi:NADH-quinone oxidoreductase subunit H